MTPRIVQQKFLEARDQIHLIHLNTFSYAEHKALDAFYTGWLNLVDSFIETYQGKNGRIGGPIQIEVNSAMGATGYLTALRGFIEQDAMNIVREDDIDLQNILSDMRQLINQTLYLLTLK